MSDVITDSEQVKAVVQGVSAWIPVISTLAGGVLAGSVAIGVSWLNHHFARGREEKAMADRLRQENENKQEKIDPERHFIATELVFVLERFAESCSYVASDTGEDNTDPQPTREPTVDYPELSFSDVSGDWRVLDTRLMYRIRELPVLQMEANKAIANIGEGDNYGSRREYFRERWYRYAGLGLKAIIQARRLRRMAGFPDTTLARTHWSALYVMKDVWRIERRRRAKEAIENRDLFKDIEPPEK
ncbi:hypothetical protein JW319_22310 [Enterobacter cloacae subsp. cloacae]|uniref:hypothetical protein n=1 Tax=Enterobacter cloacae TaxID=550 RepID=UPI001C5B7F04|nr:hypothetical protein [Enterobacter cloacae]MBW4204093.1 hypothetical protein [Enterobacter cloacae subsp. cloacae]